MTDKMKRILLIVAIVTFTVAWVILGVLSYKTESFALDVIAHVVMRSAKVSLAIAFIFRFLKKELHEKSKFVSVICCAVIAIDLVVIDAARYIVTCGHSIVLFLPAFIPVCYIIILHHICKTSNAERTDHVIARIIGYALLALSIYFEIISFM